MIRIRYAVLSTAFGLVSTQAALAQQAVQYVRVPAAELLTPVRAFGDATPLVQATMLILVVAIVGAVAAWAMARSRPDAAMAYLRAVIVGGPLIGLLGAVYGVMNGFLGISNIRPAPTITVVAPGIVEALLVFGLGLAAAIVAVICRWGVEGRPSRLAIV